jgi:hypothetical protein
MSAVGHETANRAVEIAVTQTMVDRVERRFDLRPRRLAGDTAYGAVRLLKWLVDRNITPHVPVWDKSVRPDGSFSRADDQARTRPPFSAGLFSTQLIEHVMHPLQRAVISRAARIGSRHARLQSAAKARNA